MTYTKGRKIYIILSAIALLAVLVTIFVLSAQNGQESSSTSGFFTELISKIFGQAASEDIIRTLAHFCEYAGLGFLTCNFIFALKDRLRPVPGIIFSVLYAVSDEIHQYFVPDRSCQLSDLAVDSLGIIAGATVFCILLTLATKIKHKKAP